MRPDFKKLLCIAKHTFKINVIFAATEPQFYVKNRKAYIALEPYYINESFVNQVKRNKLLPRLARELSHELGHYIVAPAGRRRHPDYGIREGQIKKEYDVSPKINFHWNLDEAKAIVVENELLKICGFKFYKHPLKRRIIYRNIREIRANASRWWNDSGKIDFYNKIKNGI